jgi:hypothetical protein
MAWTQVQVDALKTAIANGYRTHSVQYADRAETITLHSLSEMIELLRLMEADVAGTVVEGAMPRPRSWAVYSTKGF